MAKSSAPLVVAVGRGDLAFLTPAVRIGATVACLGVLLSLLAGVSRTAFSMASKRDLPAYFEVVHPRHKVPHRAELAVGALVVAIVMIADVRGAIGFSSFAVLAYYGIANASALTLAREERTYPKWIAAGGLLGCTLLAFSLPIRSVVLGTAVLAVGAVIFTVTAKRRAESTSK
ncbi:APC family permease [Variovorax paradoxus]|nr:APC family permease [Variovorax paradoxus]